MPFRRAHTRAAVAGVAAFVLAACGVTAWQVSAHHAPEQLNAWQVDNVTDGLNRVVVRVDPAAYLGDGTGTTLTGEPADADAVADTGATSSRQDVVPGANSDSGRRIDFTLLAHAQATLRGHGSVGFDGQGRIAWIVGDRSIPVEATDQSHDPATVAAASARTASPASAPKAVPATTKKLPDSTNPQLVQARKAAAWLRTQPWVEHAQPTHAGDVVVATSLDADRVADQDGVVDATPSLTVPVASLNAPNDPYWSYAWHLKNTGYATRQTATAGADVGALDAWAYSQGQGTVVAVIDTGYMSAHPDLAGALWTNPREACGATTDTDGDGHVGDCHGWNYYAGSASIDNGAGGVHGTTVSGVIAARLDNGAGGAGLAPQTSIMPLVAGSGTTIDMGLAIEAIYYAVDHGADVINGSFGGAMAGTALDRLATAVAYARSHGVLVVVAAGNDNMDRDATPLYPASLADPGLVTVGASDAADNRSSFSAWGKTSVDLFAPGTYVLTTSNDGGYQLVSGTSIASPLVAAAAALARSADPTLTPVELRTALMATGDHPESLANLSVSGARLSAARLLAGALAYDLDARNGVEADTPSPVTVTATGDAPSTATTMRLTLGYQQDGQTWAVAGLPVGTITGTLTTDDDGAIEVPVTGSAASEGASATIDLTLPGGDFALVSQLMDGGTALGRPAVAILPVRAAGSTAPTPTGSSTPSATESSAPGGSDPGGDPAPSSSASPTTMTPPVGGGEPAPWPGWTPAPSTTSGTAPSSAPAPSTTSGVGPGSPRPPATTSAPAPWPGGGSSPSTTSPPKPSTSPSTTAPTTAPTPSTSLPTGGSSGGSTPPPPGSSPTPTVTKTYPGTGGFGITSLSPANVSTAGGTLVTVTGTSLPAGVRVLVGGASATVMGGNTARQLSFYAPARIAGSYDVEIFASPGTDTVTLAKALTYSRPTAPGGGGGDDGGSGGSSPSATTSGTASPGATSTSPAAGPVTATGPGGLRLVRSGALAALTAAAWSRAPRCDGRCTATSL